MGRGRAKAKQAKVARQLKYAAGGATDLARLEAELARNGGDVGGVADEAEADEDPERASASD
jgi:hypothetical protein